MLARDLEKARQALQAAKNAARAEASRRTDLARRLRHRSRAGCGGGRLIFESLAEELPLKQEFFEKIDQSRHPESIVATDSSGLSIAEMARGRSDSFRRHFLGVHLFNPPHVIVGTEVIPHPDTDAALADQLKGP